MRVLSGFVDSLALTAEHRLCALSLSKLHHCVQRDLLACSKDRHKSHYQIAQLFGPSFITLYFAYKVANTSLKTYITWLWLAREILAGRFSLGRLKSTDEDMHIKRKLLLVLTNKPRRWNWNTFCLSWRTVIFIWWKSSHVAEHVPSFMTLSDFSNSGAAKR